MKEENEVEMIHKEIQQINKKLDRVLLTLLGDEDMNIDGLEKYIQKQKLFLAKMGGMATAMGVIGGLIVQLILKLIS